jgi:hypothetical protein
LNGRPRGAQSRSGSDSEEKNLCLSGESIDLLINYFSGVTGKKGCPFSNEKRPYILLQ